MLARHAKACEQTDVEPEVAKTVLETIDLWKKADTAEFFEAWPKNGTERPMRYHQYVSPPAQSKKGQNKMKGGQISELDLN
jgi:hypothetical protein